MWVHLGGTESIGQSRAADLEFELVVRARAESRTESPGRMTSQHGESGLFRDWVVIANRPGIGVMVNRNRSELP